MDPSYNQSDSENFSEALARRISNKRLVDVLWECMHATTVLKNGVVIPDWRARLEAIKLILAYMIGTPIARQEIVVSQLDDDDDEDFIDKMARSPMLLACMKRQIARAEARKLEIEAQESPFRPRSRLPGAGS